MNGRKLCVLAVLIALIAIQGCSESNSSDVESEGLLKEAFPWLKGTGRTDDTAPVEIELVDERSGESLKFRIPKAYLTDTANWAGGRQDRVKIETGLPNLEPRPGNIWITEEPGTPEYEREIKFFRNGLFIHVYANRPVLGYENNKREAYQDRYVIQNDSLFGLTHFKSIACRDWKRTAEGEIVQIEEICRERGNEHFITPEARDGKWVSFYCTRLEVNQGGGCIARSLYQGWSLEYIFRRNQLNRWRDFDAGARELLDRFLVQPGSENETSLTND